MKETAKKEERNSTIEILKLLLMFGVVVLHTCGVTGRAIEVGGVKLICIFYERYLFVQ